MLILVDRKNLILAVLAIVLSSALFLINSGEERAAATTAEIGSGTLVVIDPGHGGEDPGAVSDYSGTSEKNINLHIGLKVKELLEASGLKVVMTRTEDVLQYPEGTKGYTAKRQQDLIRRKKLMDESGAGAVFFPNQPVESKELAVSIQKALKEFVEPGNSREALIKREPLIILKNAKVPTVIVECGFLSNREEEKKLIEKDYQDKLADAIAKGTIQFLLKGKEG